MRITHPAWRLAAAAAVTAVVVTGGTSGAASKPPAQPKPTKDIACGKGSLPEKIQGRAPAADFKSGRAAKGYTCNAVQVSHFGSTGGYRVERYVDKAGHECAYYDSTLLFPTS
ncbi:MAG: hypothetical protein QOJ03_941, partial [Frankiaceae bacterium]|nr:hypothetical protein [Frankiaceae bacterium]